MWFQILKEKYVVSDFTRKILSMFIKQIKSNINK